MDRADEQTLIRRVTAHLAAKTSDLADAPTRQPVDAYTNPKHFQLELERVFRREPFVVGHRSQLAQPGDFLTGSLDGVPWLITCPERGQLRAFLNVCRHRGTLLVSDSHGSGCQTFTCPYHAWSYHADGRLLGVAHERTFGSVDRTRQGLVPLSVTEHAGLVWLSLAEDAPPPSFPAALDHDLHWLAMTDHVVYRPHRRRWRFNWKIGVDGGLEAYHFRYAHGRSIYPMFFDNLLVYDDFSPHARLTLPKRSIRELAEPAHDWRIREHANLLYFLFPNTFLIAQEDYVALICMTPIAPDESEIVISMLIPEAPTSDRARAHWDKNFEITVGALDEDFELGERIQATLRSGANSHLTFGRNELGLARFHAAVQRCLTDCASRN